LPRAASGLSVEKWVSVSLFIYVYIATRSLRAERQEMSQYVSFHICIHCHAQPLGWASTNESVCLFSHTYTSVCLFSYMYTSPRAASGLNVKKCVSMSLFVYVYISMSLFIYVYIATRSLRAERQKMSQYVSFRVYIHCHAQPRGWTSRNESVCLFSYMYTLPHAASGLSVKKWVSMSLFIYVYIATRSLRAERQEMNQYVSFHICIHQYVSFHICIYCHAQPLGWASRNESVCLFSYMYTSVCLFSYMYTLPRAASGLSVKKCVSMSLSYMYTSVCLFSYMYTLPRAASGLSVKKWVSMSLFIYVYIQERVSMSLFIYVYIATRSLRAERQEMSQYVSFHICIHPRKSQYVTFHICIHCHAQPRGWASRNESVCLFSNMYTSVCHFSYMYTLPRAASGLIVKKCRYVSFHICVHPRKSHYVSFHTYIHWNILQVFFL